MDFLLTIAQCSVFTYFFVKVAFPLVIHADNVAEWLQGNLMGLHLFLLKNRYC